MTSLTTVYVFGSSVARSLGEDISTETQMYSFRDLCEAVGSAELAFLTIQWEAQKSRSWRLARVISSMVAAEWPVWRMVEAMALYACFRVASRSFGQDAVVGGLGSSGSGSCSPGMSRGIRHLSSSPKAVSSSLSGGSCWSTWEGLVEVGWVLMEFLHGVSSPAPKKSWVASRESKSLCSGRVSSSNRYGAILDRKRPFSKERGKHHCRISMTSPALSPAG